MQFKSIFVLSIVSTAATAAPVEDIETRQASCPVATAPYCCDSYLAINIPNIINGIGLGHCVARVDPEKCGEGGKPKVGICCQYPNLSSGSVTCLPFALPA
ncbi:hypothetical protein N7495_000203 [Penicillium taxi]|uniref:uncharacterized protein n=1 Tax=Penicillium taxi TaxID=168475 RepID=UPI0025455570|nr:uncharacterized protein N7495_000203 [Penicillium taxi]KAJ5907521.1 hypothetical protein N7495_000203 [Penicillium taxi]